MGFAHDRLDVYRAALEFREECAEYAEARIDTDTDSDSDAERDSGIAPLLPNA